jgi:hypothetical protein
MIPNSVSGTGDPASVLETSECPDRWDTFEGDLPTLLPIYVFSCTHLSAVESRPTIPGGVAGLLTLVIVLELALGNGECPCRDRLLVPSLDDNNAVLGIEGTGSSVSVGVHIIEGDLYAMKSG